MQFPGGITIKVDTVFSGATLLVVLGLWGRFTIVESHVKDLWNDFIRRTKEGE